jgi:hypothetical protein
MCRTGSPAAMRRACDRTRSVRPCLTPRSPLQPGALRPRDACGRAPSRRGRGTRVLTDLAQTVSGGLNGKAENHGPSLFRAGLEVLAAHYTAMCTRPHDPGCAPGDRSRPVVGGSLSSKLVTRSGPAVLPEQAGSRRWDWLNRRHLRCDDDPLARSLERAEPQNGWRHTPDVVCPVLAPALIAVAMGCADVDNATEDRKAVDSILARGFILGFAAVSGLWIVTDGYWRIFQATGSDEHVLLDGTSRHFVKLGRLFPVKGKYWQQVEVEAIGASKTSDLYIEVYKEDE